MEDGFRPNIKGYKFYTTSDKSYPGTSAGKVIPWVVLVNGEWSTSSDLGARERWLCINVVYSGGSTLIHQSDAYHDGSGHQVRLRVFSTRLDIFNALGYDEKKITTITGFNNNGSTGVGYTPSVIAWLEKE